MKLDRTRRRLRCPAAHCGHTQLSCRVGGRSWIEAHLGNHAPTRGQSRRQCPRLHGKRVAGTAQLINLHRRVALIGDCDATGDRAAHLHVAKIYSGRIHANRHRGGTGAHRGRSIARSAAGNAYAQRSDCHREHYGSCASKKVVDVSGNFRPTCRNLVIYFRNQKARKFAHRQSPEPHQSGVPPTDVKSPAHLAAGKERHRFVLRLDYQQNRPSRRSGTGDYRHECAILRLPLY